jgi:hypothetical protein
MKTKTLWILLSTFASILNACSPAQAVIPTDEEPALMVDREGYEALLIDDV